MQSEDVTVRHLKEPLGTLLVLFACSTYAYDRNDYPHWIDSDGDGQDTRQEILIRDSLIEETFREDGRVENGLWVCPYTGRVSKALCS